MSKPKVIGCIYSTKDYSMFHRLEGNRQVTTARKNMIGRSIDEVGYVLNPIVVNEFFQVVEGQGRLEALKERNMEVPYVIAKGAGRKECIAMNQNNTKWNTKDFICSYAEEGNENYKRLLRILDMFPYIKLQAIHGIIRNTIVCAGSEAKFLVSGDLIFTEKTFNEIVPVCKMITDASEVLEKIPGSSRLKITAFAWIVRNTDCNRQRLLDQLYKKYPILSPAIDGHPDIFLKELSEIYNKKLAPKNCIDFDHEYTKYIREN